MENETKPSLVIAILFLAIITGFFGGAILLFVNALFPFLSEGTFALIALPYMAIVLIGLVAGKSYQVITWFRSKGTPGFSNPDEEDGEEEAMDTGVE